LPEKLVTVNTTTPVQAELQLPSNIVTMMDDLGIPTTGLLEQYAGYLSGSQVGPSVHVTLNTSFVSYDFPITIALSVANSSSIPAAFSMYSSVGLIDPSLCTPIELGLQCTFSCQGCDYVFALAPNGSTPAITTKVTTESDQNYEYAVTLPMDALDSLGQAGVPLTEAFTTSNAQIVPNQIAPVLVPSFDTALLDPAEPITVAITVQDKALNPDELTMYAVTAPANKTVAIPQDKCENIAQGLTCTFVCGDCTYSFALAANPPPKNNTQGGWVDGSTSTAAVELPSALVEILQSILGPEAVESFFAPIISWMSGGQVSPTFTPTWNTSLLNDADKLAITIETTNATMVDAILAMYSSLGILNQSGAWDILESLSIDPSMCVPVGDGLKCEFNCSEFKNASSHPNAQCTYQFALVDTASTNTTPTGGQLLNETSGETFSFNVWFPLWLLQALAKLGVPLQSAFEIVQGLLVQGQLGPTLSLTLDSSQIRDSTRFDVSISYENVSSASQPLSMYSSVNSDTNGEQSFALDSEGCTQTGNELQCNFQCTEFKAENSVEDTNCSYNFAVAPAPEATPAPSTDSKLTEYLIYGGVGAGVMAVSFITTIICVQIAKANAPMDARWQSRKMKRRARLGLKFFLPKQISKEHVKDPWAHL